MHFTLLFSQWDISFKKKEITILDLFGYALEARCVMRKSRKDRRSDVVYDSLVKGIRGET